MNKPLPYPPPWQDAPTLCAHICVTENTLDAWVKQKGFPPARMRGGKRMWKWAEVEAWLDGEPGIVPGESDLRRVHDATKAAAGG